jgi:hypothetical protein
MFSQRRVAQLGLLAVATVLVVSMGVLVWQNNDGSDKPMTAGKTAVVDRSSGGAAGVPGISALAAVSHIHPDSQR